MPLYMTQFSYTPEGWAALAQNPEDGSQAVRTLVECMGGRLGSYYYSFGEYGGVEIYEAPDEATASAIPMVAVSAGHLKATKTTVLLSVEEGMDA